MLPFAFRAADPTLRRERPPFMPVERAGAPGYGDWSEFWVRGLHAGGFRT
jgi:hypothetical protein